MASQILYPPIVDSYAPSFVVLPGGNNTMKLRFGLSKYNGSQDFTSVHVSIKKQSTGEKVINAEGWGRTGILLNVPVNKINIDNNEYEIEIADSALKTVLGEGDKYKGWVPGTIYQIQIRLSEGVCPDIENQIVWLNENASSFSEWSTICVTKPISEPKVTILSIAHRIDDDTVEPYKSYDIKSDYFISGANFIGQYNTGLVEDNAELYSYQVSLLSEDFELLEQSNILYTNQNINRGDLRYTFKYDFQGNTDYNIKLNTVDTGDYCGEWVIPVKNVFVPSSRTTLGLYTAENGAASAGYSTTIALEEDDGRVGIFIKGTEESVDASGKYIIRRASSKDNFSTWEDIKEFDWSKINPLVVDETFYDYTIESGVFYKYGIQLLDKQSTRGELVVTATPIIREFYFSYLLGDNGKQLRLMYNTTIGNIKINKTESVKPPLDAEYPFVMKSGKSKYKSFSINSLISFSMDENNLFMTKEEIYNYKNIIDMYEQRKSTSSYNQYNYVYEKDFRDKVLEFLHDDKVKLFKSPTEGNILIRITGISLNPEEKIDRLIYNFSSTATEIAKYSSDNLKKYNFI